VIGSSRTMILALRKVHENVMKVRYVKELNKVEVHIEVAEYYYEDYQMSMIRENEIAGLASAKVWQVDDRSIFIYDVSGMSSLKSRYEGRELKYADIRNIVGDLLSAVKELRGYLLNPDYLVLEPSLIYTFEDKWVFLYLPAKKSNLNKAFHSLTEYFVRTLDYKEEEGIMFASFLHKETLQENFNLEQILSKYENYKASKVERKIRSNEVREDSEKRYYAIETDEADDEDDDEEEKGFSLYKESHDVLKWRGEKAKGARGVKEKRKDGKGKKEGKTRVSIIDKAKNRFGRKSWGDWDDLILDD